MQIRYKIVLILALLCLVSAVGAAPKKNSTKSTSAKKVNRSEVQRKYRSKMDLPMQLLRKKDSLLKKLIITSSLFIKKNPRDRQVYQWLENRAIAYYSIGRNQFVAGKITESRTKKYLHAAISDANRLLAVKNRFPPQDVERFYYIKGGSYLLLDQRKNAVAVFKEATQYTRSTELSAWIFFFLAEEAFEEQEFAEAEFYYKKSIERSPRFRSISRYKLAWTYMNQNKLAASEDTFVLVINTAEPSVQLDALADVSFIATRFRTEDQILNIAYKKIQKADYKRTFLKNVLIHRAQEKTTERSPRIINGLLRLSRTPNEKFEVLLINLSAVRKEFYSKTHSDAYSRTAQFAQKHFKNLSKEHQETFEQESEIFVHTLYESYFERLKSPESFEKKQLFYQVKQAIDRFQGLFPKSPLATQMSQRLVEMCRANYDWPCVYRLSSELLKNKELPQKEQVLSYEFLLEAARNLYSSNKKKYDRIYTTTLLAYYKNLPKGKNYPFVVAEIGQLSLEKKKYRSAVKFSKLAFEAQENAPNFYRLQWSRFQARDFDELVKMSKSKFDKKDKRLTDIYQEAYLRLAEMAIKKKDFDEYLEHTNAFIKENKSKERQLEARLNQANVLLGAGRQEEAVAIFEDLPSRDKKKRDFEDLILRLCEYDLGEARFDRCRDWIVKSSRGKKLHFYFYLTGLALDKKVNQSSLEGLSPAETVFLTNLYTFLEPKKRFSYLKSKKTSEAEVAQLYASAMIVENGELWNLDQRTRAKLEITNLKDPAISVKKIESETEKVQKLLEQKPNQENFESILNQLETSKGKIESFNIIDDRSSLISLVKSLSSLEMAVGKFLESTPLPQGLSESQIKEAKAELSVKAREFYQQATEYKKLIDSFESLQRQYELTQAPQIDVSDWPFDKFYNDVSLKPVKKLIRDKDYREAFVLLHFLEQRKKVSPTAFEGCRAGLIINLHKNRGSQELVFSGLLQKNEKRVTNFWRAIK